MGESKLNPEDINLYGQLVQVFVKNQKKNNEQGALAEMYFLVGMAIGVKQPELVQEARNYLKYSRNLSLDELVEDTIKTLNNAIERYKKDIQDS